MEDVKQNLEAFEMWYYYRMMLGIKGMDKVTDEWVLEIMRENRSL